MRKSSKFLALILAGISSAVSLTACGGTGNGVVIDKNKTQLYINTYFIVIIYILFA